MNFFRVIIPTYKNEDTLRRAVDSVVGQKFCDYDLIVVEDNISPFHVCNLKLAFPTNSNSQSSYRVKNCDTIVDADGTECSVQRYSGGSRNRAIFDNDSHSKYTLFLDADDDFVDENVFQELHDFIVEHDYPDMVRLPYIRHNPDGSVKDQTPNILREKNIEDVTNNCRVGCWTKAVRSNLVQRFPENTLCEDVCQHLKQCDVTNTVAWFPRAVVNWHIRPDSTSNSCSEKWKSSCYRFVADLMDLELTKPYTKARRDVKLAEAIQNLRDGKWLQ